MKKTYEKPLVSFESFAFSSNIAAGCSAVPGIQGDMNSCSAFGTQNSPSGGCVFISDGAIIFTSAACIDTPQEENQNDLCYHVSTDATRMFMS